VRLDLDRVFAWPGMDCHPGTAKLYPRVMPDIPGWDEEIHGAIRALVEVVGDRLQLCTTSTQQTQVRQVAAAYLARVRRLVVGMDALYEAEMPDVIGSVLRVCLEAWITGMWVLVVREEALVALNADYVRRGNLLIERAGLDVESLDPVDEESALPSVKARFEAVEDRLVAEGDGNVGEVVWTYQLVYGAESSESIHAGLASVIRHLIEEPEWWGVAVIRQQPGDGAGKILWAATLLAMLARRVFREFAIGTDDLDEVASPIQQLAVDLNDNLPQDPPNGM
jgi:hypothetical protein